MNKYIVFFCLLCAFFTQSLHAEDAILLLNQKEYKKVLKHKPYVYGRKGDRLKIKASFELIKELQEKKLPYKTLYKTEKELQIKTKAVVSNEKFVKYHEMVETIDLLAKQHSDLVEKIVIGQSVDGRDIVGLKTILNKEAPKYRIVGGIHGDEAMSYQVVFNFMVELIQLRKMHQELLENTQIYFIPMLNPDGAVEVERRNKNNIDLNRNLGFYWRKMAYSGDQAFSEPESKALRDFTLKENFTLSFSLHTFGDIINYVWNCSPDDVADLNEVLSISSLYHKNTDYDVTEGFDWYQTTGDLNDYSYGTVGTLDWTIEMDDYDDGSLYKNNKNALLAALNTYQYGIEGMIKDEEGNPLEATLVIDGERVFYNQKNGYFYRYLLAGNYEIQVVKNGYETFKADVEIGESKKLFNVVLKKSKEEDLFMTKVIALEADLGDQKAYHNMSWPKYLLFEPDDRYFDMPKNSRLLLELPKRKEKRELELLLKDNSNENIVLEALEEMDGEVVETYTLSDAKGIWLANTVHYLRVINKDVQKPVSIDAILLIKEEDPTEPTKPTEPKDVDSCSYTIGSNSQDFSGIGLLLFIMSVYIYRRRKVIESK